MKKTIKRPNLLIIGIALMVIPMLFGNTQLQATTNPTYVNFRTTDLSYSSGGVAFTNNCGQTLTKAGYSSTYNYFPSVTTCDMLSTKGNHNLNINIPGNIGGVGTVRLIGDTTCSTCDITICQDNSGSILVKQFNPLLSTTISTSPNSLDPSKEVSCGTSTATTTLPGTTSTTVGEIGICIVDQEICDGKDNDCDHLIDEELNCDTSTTTLPSNGGCTSTSWSPDSSTTCSDKSFTQTSNCGTTRTVQGTKDCSEDFFSKVLFTIGDFEVTGLYLIIAGGLLIVLALI